MSFTSVLRQKWLRIAGVALALAAALFPVAYLMWKDPASHVATAQGPGLQQDEELTRLESAVRTDPSPANRLNLSLVYLVRQQPGEARAWNNLCVAHTMVQDYAVAVDECNRALQIEPQFQLAGNNLRWAKGEADHMRQEIARLEATTPPSARNPAFLMNLGLLQLHVGEYDRAIDAWKRVLTQQPQSAVAMNDLGMAYMMKKDPPQAAEWFRHALSQEPGFTLAENNLKWAQSEGAR